MVSLWPWNKGDDSSPASFERALSALSERIAKYAADLDSLHATSRRFKALWTLYSSFAYILYSIILALVVGWHNWGPGEYGAIIGGPIIIFGVRYLLNAYYTYRISRKTERVEELEKERETTIEKLKTATKYNSTQQLLEKYGGSTPQPSPSAGSSQKRKSGRVQDFRTSPDGNKRTTGAPPPTANIPRNSPLNQHPSTPQSRPSLLRHELTNTPPTPLSRQSPEVGDLSRVGPGPPQFAPNAYSDPPPQYSDSSQTHWYDRVLDLLLGDDETLPKNRFALICKSCRLVNGQAPPGTRRLEDVGRWKCASCGGWNGEESEVGRIVSEIKENEHHAREVRKSRSSPLTENKAPTLSRDDHDGNDDNYDEDEGVTAEEGDSDEKPEQIHTLAAKMDPDAESDEADDPDRDEEEEGDAEEAKLKVEVKPVEAAPARTLRARRTKAGGKGKGKK
ncbi:MAG: hypothetical protein M1825_000780 [Sarcosagium campestre]|nr:MAG: hypothetical protein M1825_000780 [Sarcosagium campestre]